MTKPRENRPNMLWPVGTLVRFLDAWGRNPVEGRIIRHINAVEVLVEDEKQVRYFGETWRIASAPPDRRPDPDRSMFEDILG